MKFEVKVSKNNEYYARIVANNGEIIFVSETVKNKADILSTINSLITELRKGSTDVIVERKDSKTELFRF
jgi:uncharacterized protein YegP (UPF0339 family)